MCKFSEKVKKYVFEVRDGKVFYTVNSGKEIAIERKSQLTDEIMCAFIVFKKDKESYIEFLKKYENCKIEKVVNTEKDSIKKTNGTDIRKLRMWFVEKFEDFKYLIKKLEYVSTRVEIESTNIDELFA